MRKLCLSAAVGLLVLTTVPVAAAEQKGAMAELQSLETTVFGKSRASLPLETRVRALEVNLFGNFHNGPISGRLTELNNAVKGTASAPSEPVAPVAPAVVHKTPEASHSVTKAPEMSSFRKGSSIPPAFRKSQDSSKPWVSATDFLDNVQAAHKNDPADQNTAPPANSAHSAVARSTSTATPTVYTSSSAPTSVLRSQRRSVSATGGFTRSTSSAASSSSPPTSMLHLQHRPVKTSTAVSSDSAPSSVLHLRRAPIVNRPGFSSAPGLTARSPEPGENLVSALAAAKIAHPSTAAAAPAPAPPAIRTFVHQPSTAQTPKQKPIWEELSTPHVAAKVPAPAAKTPAPQQQNTAGGPQPAPTIGADQVSQMFRPSQSTPASSIQGSSMASSQNKSVQRLIDLSSNEMDKGNYENAIQLLDQVTQQEPDNASARYALSQAYRSQGDLIKARAAIFRAIAIEPTNPTYRQAMRGMAPGAVSDDSLPSGTPYMAPSAESSFPQPSYVGPESLAPAQTANQSPSTSSTGTTTDTKKSSVLGSSQTRLKNAATGGVQGAAMGAVSGMFGGGASAITNAARRGVTGIAGGLLRGH